ncbi:MAG: DUF4058 family protein, partial [Chloroflexi bacterium]|nr:DUF4058 family protein [Chloroflexota bacterium]
FPGMDPYLERRGLWEEIHPALIIELQQFLSPLVRPRYRVAVERRTYLAVLAPDDLIGKPDVLILAETRTPFGSEATATAAGPRIAELPVPEEILERYLEVREVATGEVITVIEIISPTNKQSREGRRAYEEKRGKVLSTRTHLVEIDLLRAGAPMAMRVREDGQRGQYRIVVSRAYQRPRADVYLFSLRQPIPAFPVPLRKGETEPTVDLNAVVHDLYDRAGYDLAVDYRQEPDPPLEADDAIWADALLRQCGARG